MPLTALWEVSGSRPVRITGSRIALESHLESWIESDPGMLPGDLDVVARQLVIEAGKLDLLGLDRQGRLHVIEIKRGVLTRDTIAQGIDYAACIESMDTQELTRCLDAYLGPRGRSIASMLDERQAASALERGERDVAIMVVGIGRDPGLERVTAYLAQRDLDLTLVSFEAFQTDDGRQILSREVTEDEPISPSSAKSPQVSLDELRQRAASAGIGAPFATLVDAGLREGLHHRTYRNSVMFAPPNMKYRALFTIWAQPRDGKVRAWIGNRVFADFFPGVSAEDAAASLGNEGWHNLDQPGADAFAQGLQRLLGSPRDD